MSIMPPSEQLILTAGVDIGHDQISVSIVASALRPRSLVVRDEVDNYPILSTVTYAPLVKAQRRSQRGRLTTRR